MYLERLERGCCGFSEVDPVNNEILRKKEEQDREKSHRHLSKVLYTSFYRVIFKDNGRGMPHDDIPMMFGRVSFGTKYGLKQTRGQYGLGAKMVLNLVRWTTSCASRVPPADLWSSYGRELCNPCVE